MQVFGHTGCINKLLNSHFPLARPSKTFSPSQLPSTDLQSNFFAHCPSHPNPLVQQIGNTLADLTTLYNKYNNKRPKHVLLKLSHRESQFVSFLGFYTALISAVAQWLMCCATNRKVAGSIPAGVSGFFIDIKSFRSHYGPGVDSASNRNEYQEYFLGVKAAGA